MTGTQAASEVEHSLQTSQLMSTATSSKLHQRSVEHRELPPNAVSSTPPQTTTACKKSRRSSAQQSSIENAEIGHVMDSDDPDAGFLHGKRPGRGISEMPKSLDVEMRLT
ncbi:hypothetical protein BWQ96_08379 [Gracilariopsis chorda]|uniref:Uncharacterized protein n=1 Tax=Gracilariopsis chorda TaxID=448386 RepID=A0A2V3III7_9FLOR|nr:hypothetical protein BWQ96_08379 [Gracilariopsis chorda]|eukprot:PXF41897.1 hypothetical protein BWQ96_08379 [Gracilariopsis chorda]